MSMPLPSGRLSPLALRYEFSALRAPHWSSTAPLTNEGHQ